MKIKKEIVENVARIARLDLTQKEVEKFEEDFRDILKDFSKLKKVSTDCVKPTFSTLEFGLHMSSDCVQKSITNSQALSNTKNKEKGFFKGPKTI